MSKKTIFIRIVTLLILCFSSVVYADQYYYQYPGTCFVPGEESSSYYRDWIEGFLLHDDTSDATYYCPIHFNVPDGSSYFIKSIGIRFKDNLIDGMLIIRLRRQNLYTGAVHDVAFWQSGTLWSSDSSQTASQGTYDGKKLIDTKKFAYWLFVHFQRDGDINPSSGLLFYQVRIHYGT